MIVKVQPSQKVPTLRVIIHNEHRDLCFQTEATPELVKLFKREKKLFLYATMNGTVLRLGGRAPLQDW